MAKPLLRLQYEFTIGEPISDKTWDRIKRTLGINRYNHNKVEMIPVIRAYGELRLMNPKGLITAEAVTKYMEFEKCFPLVNCTGEDLWAAILKSVKDANDTPPSKNTIYRWGREIGVPITKSDRVYTKAELRKWIGKLVGLSEFRLIVRFPGIEKITAA